MKRIATLCCVSLIQASVVTAAEPTGASSNASTSAAFAASKSGPLRQASISKDPQRLFRSETRRANRSAVDDDDQDTGNWMERHPVWAGTIIGFGAGFAITYAMGATEKQDPDAIFKGIPPSGPALVFGGVAAGIGALAGWGIGRGRDKNPNPDLGSSAAVAGRQVR
jgi:hypothetical protein